MKREGEGDGEEERERARERERGEISRETATLPWVLAALSSLSSPESSSVVRGLPLFLPAAVPAAVAAARGFPPFTAFAPPPLPPPLPASSAVSPSVPAFACPVSGPANAEVASFFGLPRACGVVMGV